MADSLVLTGVKDVKKHTGTEMLLTRPKRGGDTHSVKEWWRNGVSTVYASCTIFDVTVGGDTVKLVLDTGVSTNVRIDHDGAFNFTFIRPNEIRRGALFTSDMELIEHYVFPAISGGKVMTVIPAGAAAKPGGTPSVTIGTVTASGDATANDGETKTYSYSISGDAGDAVATWTSDDGNDTVSGNDVTFSGAGDRTLTVSVTSVTATDSPATDTIDVTVS